MLKKHLKYLKNVQNLCTSRKEVPRTLRHFGPCDKSFLNYLNLRILTCPNTHTHTHTRDDGVCTLHAPVRVRKSRL